MSTAFRFSVSGSGFFVLVLRSGNQERGTRTKNPNQEPERRTRTKNPNEEPRTKNQERNQRDNEACSVVRVLNRVPAKLHPAMKMLGGISCSLPACGKTASQQRRP